METSLHLFHSTCGSFFSQTSLMGSDHPPALIPSPPLDEESVASSVSNNPKRSENLETPLNRADPLIRHSSLSSCVPSLSPSFSSSSSSLSSSLGSSSSSLDSSSTSTSMRSLLFPGGKGGGEEATRDFFLKEFSDLYEDAFLHVVTHNVRSPAMIEHFLVYGEKLQRHLFQQAEALVLLSRDVNADESGGRRTEEEEEEEEEQHGRETMRATTMTTQERSQLQGSSPLQFQLGNLKKPRESQQPVAGGEDTETGERRKKKEEMEEALKIKKEKVRDLREKLEHFWKIAGDLKTALAEKNSQTIEEDRRDVEKSRASADFLADKGETSSFVAKTSQPTAAASANGENGDGGMNSRDESSENENFANHHQRQGEGMGKGGQREGKEKGGEVSSGLKFYEDTRRDVSKDDKTGGPSVSGASPLLPPSTASRRPISVASVSSVSSSSSKSKRLIISLADVTDLSSLEEHRQQQRKRHKKGGERATGEEGTEGVGVSYKEAGVKTQEKSSGNLHSSSAVCYHQPIQITNDEATSNRRKDTNLAVIDVEPHVSSGAIDTPFSGEKLRRSEMIQGVEETYLLMDEVFQQAEALGEETQRLSEMAQLFARGRGCLRA